MAVMRYPRSGSATVESYPGHCLSALSYYPYRAPYDFDLYRTYGVPSDAIVYGGFTVLYRLQYYKRCKGKNVTPLMLFSVFILYLVDTIIIAYHTIYVLV